MKITFCGHSDYLKNEKDEKYLLQLFEKFAENNNLEFYLGKDGNFDFFALHCAKLHKQAHPQSKIIFVTPYILQSYSKLKDVNQTFDEVIYPELENVPYKFAIVRRNEWMVKNSDIVIAHIKRNFGGAAKTLAYAERKNKRTINLAKL